MECRESDRARGEFLSDMAAAALLEGRAWAELMHVLTSGARPWREVRHRADLLLSDRRAALAAASCRLPR